MAHRFDSAGHDLVLWNRDRSKAEAMAAHVGGKIAMSPADAARAATTIVTSLGDDAALRDVYLGESGIAEGVRAGSVVVDTSTVDPNTVIKVGLAIEGAGAGFLDCPVSGSVSTVEAGALTVMAGGDGELLSRVDDLLSSIAAQVIHVGPTGTGAAAKLAVNSLVHGLNVALSEALVLAEKAGVDRDTAYEVFASGAAGAPFVDYKRGSYLHPESTEVAFTLDLVAKDLDLITGLAARVDAPVHQAEAGREIVGQAIDAGFGERDMSAVAVFLRGEST